MNLVDYNIGNYGSVIVLGSSNGASISRVSNNSTDTTVQALATVTIPANTLQPGDHIRSFCWWTYPAFTVNSYTKTFAPRLAGGSWAQTTISSGSTISCTINNFVLIKDATTARSNNSVSMGGSTSNATLTNTIDITADIDITFNCSWSANCAVSETLILEDYVVELIRRQR